jgi:hypothetical protein
MKKVFVYPNSRRSIAPSNNDKHTHKQHNMNTNIRIEVHNNKDKSVITFTDSRKIKHSQKDTTNGAKRVRIEGYKDMALNSVIRVMQKSERASKQRDERRAKRAR